ncbi:MAG: OmpA family protein [Bacteroidia bacterium]|nr:OmpA family protein [Bacteroidia bacterium]
MRRYLLITLLCLSAAFGNAQSDISLYGLQTNPHRLHINPAYMLVTDNFLGLPLISNNYVHYGNSSFTYRNLIRQKEGTEQVFFDLTGWLGKLRKNSFISTQVNLDLFSVGWQQQRWYISANVTEKVNFRFRFPRELAELGINGNTEKLGEEINLGALRALGTHYREYGIAFSRDIQCKLRLGARVKFLQGMENLDLSTGDFTLITDPVSFRLYGVSTLQLNTSGLDKFSPDSLTQMSYLFNRGNRGLGFDFGAEYVFSDQFRFSASVVDLGGIRWKYKPVNYANQAQTYSFEGIYLNELLNTNPDSLDSGADAYVDSISNVLKIKERHDSYYSKLPTRIFLGGNWLLNPSTDLYLLMMGNFFGGKVYPTVTAGISKRIGTHFDFTSNWSYQNNSLLNIGAGFTARLSLIQLTVASDNLIGFISPFTSRTANIRVGISLVTHRETTDEDYCDKDKDGVPNRKDDCPDEKGPAGLRGCPDADGDGIINKFDDCPLEPGPGYLKGCPDRDLDSIPDKIDKCPDERGPRALDGCPDTDGDGIADKDDECPFLAGLPAFKGCPDRDGDSIPDKDDLCPDEPGLRMYGGCPDKDGDQIIDQDDQCPDVPGLKQFNGCPDRDGDGVEDRLDACPDEPGPAYNKGCPNKDQDGDGVLDDVDACPTVPGLPENKGCPLSDSDGDGVPDKLDKCPTVPGVPENNGCPPIGKEEQEILRTAFENLEFETGKAIIKASSFDELNELAKLLIKKPEWTLIISGHTDNVGKPASNMVLSKNRAISVQKYLAAQQVDIKRLKPEWFGQTRPTATNTTPEGRQKNRRVEMTIVFE